LDRLIPIGERHFRFAVREFVEHYPPRAESSRAEQCTIEGTSAIGTLGRVRRHPRLGGLLNYYDRAA